MSESEVNQAQFTLEAAALVKQNDLARLVADGVVPGQREGDEPDVSVVDERMSS